MDQSNIIKKFNFNNGILLIKRFKKNNKYTFYSYIVGKRNNMYLYHSKYTYIHENNKLFCINNCTKEEKEINSTFIEDDIENLYITSLQYIALYYCNDYAYTQLCNIMPEITI